MSIHLSLSLEQPRMIYGGWPRCAYCSINATCNGRGESRHCNIVRGIKRDKELRPRVAPLMTAHCLDTSGTRSTLLDLVDQQKDRILNPVERAEVEIFAMQSREDPCPE